MKLIITNTNEFKMKLLTLSLLLNYCGSWYLYLSNQVFEGIISKGTLFLSIFHAVLYVYFNRKRKKNLYWIVVYVLLFYIYRYCERREILDLFTYVSFYSSVDFQLINSKVKKVTTYFFVGTILLNIMHILPTAPSFFRGNMSRFTLGFNHPNAGGYFSLIIASCIFVQNYEKPRFQHILALFVLGLESYFIFNCRTAVFSIIGILVVMIIKLTGIDFFKNLLKKRIVRIFLMSSVFMLVMGLLYISENYQEYSGLNLLLSSRIENNFMYLQQYQVSLFGNPNVPAWILADDNWGLRYLDSGYLQSLLSLGAINSITYLLLLYKSMKNNLRRKDIAVVIWDLIIMLLLIVEASPLRWYFAIPILYVFSDKKNSLEKR